MAFDIRPATPDHQPIILGLTGPSGSGKTLSALLLAHGVKDVVGGDIGMIDTEGRRGLRYADKTRFPDFEFKHLDFQPPFSSDRYAEAIAAMAAAGVKTIIIDSMSHEHEGPGGYLEFHDKELDRMAGTDFKKREKMTFTAWIKPSAARRRLINSFLQVPLNFIFCFRAKEKLKIVSGGAPIPLGWQAIAGEEFVYEMIVRGLLPPGARGTPDWSAPAFAHGAAKRDDQDRHLFPDGAQITRQMGRDLANAYSGKGPARPRMEPTGGTTATSKAALVDKVKGELKEATEGGVDVLTAAWERLSAQQRQYLQVFYDDELFPAAQAVDATTEEEVI